MDNNKRCSMLRINKLFSITNRTYSFLRRVIRSIFNHLRISFLKCYVKIATSQQLRNECLTILKKSGELLDHSRCPKMTLTLPVRRIGVSGNYFERYLGQLKDMTKNLNDIEGLVRIDYDDEHVWFAIL